MCKSAARAAVLHSGSFLFAEKNIFCFRMMERIGTQISMNPTDGSKETCREMDMDIFPK